MFFHMQRVFCPAIAERLVHYTGRERSYIPPRPIVFGNIKSFENIHVKIHWIRTVERISPDEYPSKKRRRQLKTEEVLNKPDIKARRLIFCPK